jgi:hypothetical protein
MLQALHTYAGIGTPDQALVFLNPYITERPICLRASSGTASSDICTLAVTIENWMLSFDTVGLRVFALPGTAAAGQGFCQRAPFGEAEKFEAIERWLAAQWSKADGSSRRSTLPTRLIMVGNPSDAGVRLVEAASLPADSDDKGYIALSYRWGSTNTLTTTMETVRERMAHIALNQMPRTILDAVQVTRRLGVRYLWIDCLCIIQDDKDDWSREAARMGDVYMNAYCTIAAHAAEHADHGFLEESLQMEKVVAVGGHASGEPFEAEMAAYKSWIADGGRQAPDQATLSSRPLTSEAFFVARGSYGRHHLDRSELSSRGWALQERILSPRTVHFGPSGSLYFESRQGVEHVETGFEPLYAPYRGLRDALAVLDQRDESIVPGSSTSTPPETAHMVYEGWYEMITQYSGCILTNPADRMVALSGIVQKCEELTGDTCVSGIWTKNFIYCLLWLRQKEPLERRLAVPEPTWSWASVNGKIQFHRDGISSQRWLNPEIKLAGDTPHPGLSSVLELDGAVRIRTELRFLEGRVGLPVYDNVILFVGPVYDTTYWDVYRDRGRHIGWASLDCETRAGLDGLAEGITCIKVASHTHDRFDNGFDRGYMVLFISYSAESDTWQRVGMGQILDRTLFDGQAPTRIRLA